MDESGNPEGQPDGFAMPDAAPLGQYATTMLTDPAALAPHPEAFTVSGDPGPDLAQVAPAPPETRDPHKPFEAGQEDQLAGFRARDPREPIVTDTINGTPDFAPPTGKPVSTGRSGAADWAPPTGAPVAPGAWGSRVAPSGWPEGNVGAIARPTAGASRHGPYTPLSAMQAGGNLPPGVVPRYRPTQTPEARARAQYAGASAAGKFGLVVLSLPWPILIILLAGIVIPGWAMLALCIAWIIATSSAKVARVAVNRTFMIAAGVYATVWFLNLVTQNTDVGMYLYDLYVVIGRWLCAIMMVIMPIIVWRGFESHRR